MCCRTNSNGRQNGSAIDSNGDVMIMVMVTDAMVMVVMIIVIVVIVMVMDIIVMIIVILQEFLRVVQRKVVR